MYSTSSISVRLQYWKPFNCMLTNELWFTLKQTYKLFIYLLFFYLKTIYLLDTLNLLYMYK